MRAKNSAVFLDRDGVIARDVGYCSKAEDFILFSGAADAIRQLNRRDMRVIVITNQSGIARGFFTLETLAQIHQKMEADLKREGAFLDAIYFCPHHPDDGCDCRKPKSALFLQAAERFDIDFNKSFMVGDMASDIAAGEALGCRTILVSPDKEAKVSIPPDFVAVDIIEAVRWIISSQNSSGEREGKQRE